MDAAADLIEALETLRRVADDLTADEAINELDTATLQLFWREWPDLSGWAGALWRMLNADLAGPATPLKEADLEIGGSG